jgi:hypothetical protein
MMTLRCGTGGRPSRRLARLPGGAASLLPGVFLMLLPKCPLCLAAWIAASTGIALPAIVAGNLRPSLLIVSVSLTTLLAHRAVGRFRWLGSGRGPRSALGDVV